ncbi:hypothetical protein TWF694_004787 [Orbilia ellipsospora]|uniref:Uncharacterized protein n=1 Tax=Orbilia ellipsospora TaxID=2528407 RepID=A0AAV9WX98_9PEZI
MSSMNAELPTGDYYISYFELQEPDPETNETNPPKQRYFSKAGYGLYIGAELGFSGPGANGPTKIRLEQSGEKPSLGMYKISVDGVYARPGPGDRGVMVKEGEEITEWFIMKGAGYPPPINNDTYAIFTGPGGKALVPPDISKCPAACPVFIGAEGAPAYSFWVQPANSEE